jgi:hypothetical protein
MTMRSAMTLSCSIGFADLVGTRTRTRQATDSVNAKIEVRNFSFFYSNFKAINSVSMDISPIA